MAGNVAGFFFLLILTRSRNVCVLNTHSARGPHSFTAHRKKAGLEQGFLGWRRVCRKPHSTSTERAVLRKPSPGPEHSGHSWKSLENNPANCPLGQKDSNKSLYILKASVGSGGGVGVSEVRDR